MRPDVEAAGEPAPPRLPIPEIRDYQRINAELIALLDQGYPRIILDGAEGQRLLASGLRGAWDAMIEVLGPTGPELAAALDAPGLTIVARGPTADGLGRALRFGSVIIDGDAADAAGFGQSGGTIVVIGGAGHRVGLAQSGGTLAVLGAIGRLPCDRQSGGLLFCPGDPEIKFEGRGRTGGRLVRVSPDGSVPESDRSEWARVLGLASPWVAPSRLRGR